VCFGLIKQNSIQQPDFSSLAACKQYLLFSFTVLVQFKGRLQGIIYFSFSSVYASPEVAAVSLDLHEISPLAAEGNSGPCPL
jgi:hypothetical protein